MFSTKRPSTALGSAIVAALIGLGAAGSAAALDIRPHEAPAKCGARSPQVQVTVQGVTAGGILTVELYTPSKNAFLKKESRETKIRVPAKDGSQTVCFDVPAPGRYALAAYNDVNANRKLDRKLNMLPKEPFALSSNQPLQLQMPKFDDAAFNVPASGAKVTLRLETR